MQRIGAVLAVPHAVHGSQVQVGADVNHEVNRVGGADRLRMIAHERELPRRFLVPYRALFDPVPQAQELELGQ